MATFNRLKAGLWRVQVRRKGKYASKTFRVKTDAERWATEQADCAYRGQTVTSARPASMNAVGGLIRIHWADLAEAGKALGRTKQYCLEKFERDIGHVRTAHLDKQRIIEFAKVRRKAVSTCGAHRVDTMEGRLTSARV